MDLQNYSALVVEDEIIIARHLAEQLKKTNLSQIEIALSEAEAVNIFEDRPVHLVFMDIKLGHDGDGIRCAKKLQAIRDVPIVFVTSYSDQMTLERASEIQSSTFLKKPYQFEDIRIAAQFALLRGKKSPSAPSIPNKEAPLFVRVRGKLNPLETSSILYIKAVDNYCQICTAETQFTISKTLKTVTAQLNSNEFVRVHRSYVMRLDKVGSIGQNFVQVGNKEIPLGKSYRADFLTRLNIL